MLLLVLQDTLLTTASDLILPTLLVGFYLGLEDKSVVLLTAGPV